MMPRFITKTSFFIIVLVLTVGVLVAIAFTGPSQTPPSGNGQFWITNESDIYYSTGNVGIGTSTPSYKLTVDGGDVYTSQALRAQTSVCIAGDCLTGWDDIPAGAVMFFDLSSCPSGWSELTSARGRYLTGLPSGGTLAGTAGTALSNLENRAAGQHTHTVDDPGHSHGNATAIIGPGDFGAGGGFINIYTAGGTGYSELSLENSGSVAGTNAPYIQLLTCQRN